MQLLTLLKGIFVKSSKDGWLCDFEENFEFGTINDVLKPAKKQNEAKWQKYMKGDYPVIMQENGKTFARFNCYVNDKDEITTEGLITRGTKLFGSGKFEFKVRYNSGKATWPAIWLRNMSCQDPNNWKDNYYEIDICEYFGGDKFYFTHTFHTPESMIELESPHRNFSIVKNGWNTFECEYDEKSIRVYSNGSLALEVKAKKNQVFPTEYYLILSMQYGYKDLKEDKNELPKWMDIEYVRHYVKK